MSILNRCLVSLCRNQSRFRPVGVMKMTSSSKVTARKLEGKVAVVTGSTDGIGLAIAKRLAEDGAHVVVSSRRQENVDRAVKTLTSENLDVPGTICHIGNAEERKNLLATITNNDELHNLGLSLTPMKRFGEPHECAGAASFLCSDDASFITGETIVVAGGMDSRL
ncbi:dehydrogenase/reductase SDR family member 4-like [Ptychodera flava]|uniref:dehydrogenase/reductase SDR family member 4-like n=1 Tax=Ptychodera flava TaxID=63121 RepID=UPI00396A7299